MVRKLKTIAGLGWSRGPSSAQETEGSAANLVIALAQSEAAILWSTDADGRIASIHAPALAALGVQLADVSGKRITSVFEDAPSDSAISQQRSLSLKLSARAKITNHIVRCVNKNEEGAGVWLQLSGFPHYLGDQFVGYLGHAADVTHLIVDHQTKMLQEKFDEVTNFYNAAHFGKRFDAAFKSLAHAERPCALVVMEIDRFQHACERYGIGHMDCVLAEMGNRLRSALRHRGEVGRIATEQFRIFMPDVDDRGDLAEFAEHAGKLLSQPYRVHGRRIQLSVSIGIAMAPYDAVTTTELVDAANLALRSTKQSGGGSYSIFSAELAEEASRLVRIEQELEGAMERGEFALRYAPLISAGSNEVCALRAEVCWNSPELGEVLPDIFWPMIESSGASADFGEWMLRQACEDASAWPGNLSLAISPPRGFLKDPDFRKIILAAASDASFDRARIELEISEEFLSADAEMAKRLGDDLDAVGVRLVASDFGVGNSAIALLADFSFKRVEISPRFVRDWVLQPERTNAILGAIVSITRSFGVPASIREVDALDVLDAVIASGIEVVHGGVFSAPLDQAQIVDEGSVVLQTFRPRGFARQRAERITVLRKIGLVHDDHYYEVLLKNISRTGAKIAGIAGVPVGTEVVLDLGNGQLAVASVVNTDEKSQGVRFEVPLVSDGNGGLMTRHRISPYTLAEAGLPVASLSGDHEALRAWKDAKKGKPSFVQLQLTHL